MILLKNCHVFAPAPLGHKDILIAGEKIISLTDNIPAPGGVPIEIIDIKEKWVLPGLIDSHAHIAGAGGEGGPATRTEGLTLQQILAGGITTVIGCLGTDGITRSVESVLMKVKKLRAQGISAWMYTGSYQVPTPRITGSVSRDIALIEEIIGAGEIAIGDHRSSYPTLEAFIQVAQEAKIGGMMGGKAGIVNIHLGKEGNPFELLDQAGAIDGIHYNQFLPTHCNRCQEVFDIAKIYGKKGPVDLTTSSYPFFPGIHIKPSQAFFELLEAGVPAEHITLSSDAGGSLPEFDGNGNLIKLCTGEPFSLFQELTDMIAECDHQDDMIEKAISTVTANPSRLLKLENKGRIERGADADLLVLDETCNQIELLLARGKMIFPYT